MYAEIFPWVRASLHSDLQAYLANKNKFDYIRVKRTWDLRGKRYTWPNLKELLGAAFFPKNMQGFPAVRGPGVASRALELAQQGVLRVPMDSAEHQGTASRIELLRPATTDPYMECES